MEAAGASPENIARELAKLPADDPEELLQLDAMDEGRAVRLFLSLNTQWLRAGLAGMRTGLDYRAIQPVAEMLKIEMEPQVFLDLKIMEAETLILDAERAPK